MVGYRASNTTTREVEAGAHVSEGTLLKFACDCDENVLRKENKKKKEKKKERSIKENTPDLFRKLRKIGGLVTNRSKRKKRDGRIF